MDNRAFDPSHLYRWATAAVMLPLLLVVVGYGPGWILLVLTLLLTAGALLELARLLLGGASGRLRILTLSLGLVLPLTTYWGGAPGLTAATTVLVFIILLAHALIYSRHEAVIHQLGTIIFAQIYAAFALSHILLIFQMPAGRRWLFFVLAVIFAGDTAAYYVGHRWGRHKLAPAISPGKTVEGAAGGLVGSVVLALLAGKVVLPSDSADLGFVLALGFGLAAVGQAGDLMESMLKRVSQAKDSGGVFPGHGGVLDRLDSLLFAFPLTYYGVLFFT
ncbi:MAG: phosphatidate cytidylyltransferase [Syntrophobacteria bacterium]